MGVICSKNKKRQINKKEKVPPDLPPDPIAPPRQELFPPPSFEEQKQPHHNQPNVSDFDHSQVQAPAELKVTATSFI